MPPQWQVQTSRRTQQQLNKLASVLEPLWQQQQRQQRKQVLAPRKPEWRCFTCNTTNFLDRASCRQCGRTPKVQASSQDQPTRRTGGKSKQDQQSAWLQGPPRSDKEKSKALNNLAAAAQELQRKPGKRFQQRQTQQQRQRKATELWALARTTQRLEQRRRTKQRSAQQQQWRTLCKGKDADNE